MAALNDVLNGRHADNAPSFEVRSHPCCHEGSPTRGRLLTLSSYYRFSTGSPSANLRQPPQKSSNLRRRYLYTSTLALSELSWMNSRRGSTTSPISLVKMSSASSTSLIFTCSSDRASMSSVVSQSWLGFISPRPL